MSDELFDGIDVTLPDEQFAELLEQALDKRYQLTPDEEDHIVTITDEELSVLRGWSRTAGPKTRKMAIECLAMFGPCDWEDVEAWCVDSDSEVRDEILSGWSLYPCVQRCFADKKRCVSLLSSAAEKYPDDIWPVCAFRDLSMEGEEWLELCWLEANRLLDIGDAELTSDLVVCYFEHVIPDLNWGPEDSHMRPWIECDDGGRQIILLKIASYCGLDKGRLREIVEALTKVENTATYVNDDGDEVKDISIADLAKGILAGTISYDDL